MAATIFMKISSEGTNLVPEGVATISTLDGTDVSGQGWFAIESFSWGASRNVTIDIGNANNEDGGMVDMTPISVSRTFDGATAFLQTFLLKPGSTGKQIDIALTKPHREATGHQEYYRVTLTGSRLSNYSISASEGSQPSESFQLTYTSISQESKIESAEGEITDGQTVAYNATNGEVTSVAAGG